MQSETPTQIYPGIFSLYFGVFSSQKNKGFLILQKKMQAKVFFS